MNRVPYRVFRAGKTVFITSLWRFSQSLPSTIFSRVGYPAINFAVLIFVGATIQGLQAQTAATPGISIASGTSYTQLNVTLTDSTTGATIYYTTNGTTPTTSSSSVSSGGTILISQSETLESMAVASGYANSAVANASYEITGQVAAGEYHTVALKSDGTVWVWGYNIYGEIGDGTTTQRKSAVKISSLSGIVEVAAGAYHSVALKSDGTVWTWGLNTSGQCGDNTTTERNSPVEVQKSNGSGGTTNLTNIVAICAGAYHNLALDSTGHVWAWGLNGNGQLGDGGTTQQNMAEELTTTMPTGITVQELYAGAYHSLFLGTNGTNFVVYSWGLNSSGQLGDGTTTQRTSPVPITFSGIGTNTITGVSAGSSYSLALASDHSVWAWGYNSSGQLGDGTVTEHTSPEHLSLSNVTAVEAGYTHTLAIIEGSVWAWGSNSIGELGDGTTLEHTSPEQISGVTSPLLLAAGNEDSLIVTANGSLSGFGANNCSQLGDGLSMFNDNAGPVLGLTAPIQQISSGCTADFCLALDTNGTVWSWGANTYGELGDTTNFERIRPIQVGFTGLGSAKVTAVAANGSGSMALDSNGTVWSWGQADLGNGTTTGSSQPVHLSSFSGSATISAITEGDGFAMALDSSGHLWSWGGNASGQLGDNTTTTRTSPVEVLNSSGTGYLSAVTAVSSGYFHSLALVGGAVYAWGANNDGQLGNGTTTGSSLPVAVTFPGGVTITAIYAGDDFSAALDSNNHVWTWGFNDDGQLGNGNATNQTTPVEVITSPGVYLSNVVAITCGRYFCHALKSDGTVWGWGYDEEGQLGNGVLVYGEQSAVQVVNLSGVVQIGDGATFGIAVKQDGSLASWGYDPLGGVGAGTDYTVPFTIPGFNALATVPTPTVSITAPSNNATAAMGTAQTFTASASETGGTIASVSYYINSTLVGSSTTGSTYSINWTPPTYGDFTFNALATDTSGNTSYLSSPITVQVPLDSDGNGLADWWELKYFGHIGNNASSSPDGNGYSLLEDYEAGADPTNYYSRPNGLGGAETIVPTITIVSGDSQTSTPGSFTIQPLVVSVTNSVGGATLYNAPVNFLVTAGSGEVAGATPSTLGTAFWLTTNNGGEAQVYYQQPNTNGTASSISASTASQSVTFTESTTAGDGTFDAPSNGTVTKVSETEIDLTWVNNASTATSIVVQESTNNDATWTTIATLAPTATSYAATGLTPGTIYDFQVYASK